MRLDDWHSRFVQALLGFSMDRRIAAEACAELLDDHKSIRAEFGSWRATVFLVREGFSLVSRSVWATMKELLRSLPILRRDMSQAYRTVRRRPWSSLAASLMLAAGLAAVIGAAGFASAVLFRPINERDPDIRRIGATARNGRVSLNFSEAELAVLRPALEGIAQAAAVNLQPVILRVGEADTQTLAEVVTGRYFELAGFEMRLGRRLSDRDAVEGAPPVAVIGETLWRNRFASDPDVVDSQLRLNGHQFAIVGVSAAHGSSTLLGASVDAWLTTAHATTVLKRDWRTDVTDRFWTLIGSVEPSAHAQLDVALGRVHGELTALAPDRWRERRLGSFPGTLMVGSQRAGAVSLSLVLSGFAGLILLAAAANVSGMRLAATAAERGRVAILLAIGAGRGAIIRRQLIEGAFLGAAAGALALGLYTWMRVQLLNVSLLPTLALRLELPLDVRLGAITIGCGALVGTVLALGPALWVTKLNMAQTLRDSLGRGGAANLSRARRVLVGAQVAISVTLVVIAALFARSVSSLATLDVGFPRAGLVAMDFDLEPAAPPLSTLPSLAKEVLTRVSALPGVTATAMSNRAPIDASTPGMTVTTGNGVVTLEDVGYYLATAGYFDTVGLPIVQGRGFTEAEAQSEANLAIVNEALASRLWPDGDVLSRPMTLQPEGRTVQVIGVARDSKYRTLSETGRSHFYLPAPPAFGRSLLVRTQNDPRQTILALQRTLDGIGPGLVGFFPRTLEDHLAVDVLPTVTAARAALVLGILALLLSAAGLYGIVMWFVAVRQREIGVRLALGASAQDVRRLVVSQAISATLPGLVAGIALAVGLASLGRTLFVGVGILDPVALATALGAIIAVVVVASYLPSRRATRVDPLVALRDG